MEGAPAPETWRPLKKSAAASWGHESRWVFIPRESGGQAWGGGRSRGLLECRGGMGEGG